MVNSSIKTLSQTSKNSVAAFMTFNSVMTGLLNVNNRVVASIFPDSSFSTIKEMSSENDAWANIPSTEWLDIDSVRETEREKRRDAAKKSRKS